jgi:hypothetical protein
VLPSQVSHGEPAAHTPSSADLIHPQIRGAASFDVSRWIVSMNSFMVQVPLRIAFCQVPACVEKISCTSKSKDLKQCGTVLIWSHCKSQLGERGNSITTCFYDHLTVQTARTVHVALSNAAGLALAHRIFGTSHMSCSSPRPGFLGILSFAPHYSFCLPHFKHGVIARVLVVRWPDKGGRAVPG